jgi:hypothetical protein
MRPIVIASILLAALALATCGSSSDENAVREASEAVLKALADRDYATVWEYADREARESVAKQLADFKKLPKTSPLHAPMWASMKEQMDLEPEDIRDLDARGYFIAMFEGMDRARPELRRQQIQDTKTRQIVEVTVDGDTATARTLLSSGATESDQWVREDGGWRLKARSVGTGVSVTRK